jgi:DNA polymerase III epsilon subunit-like protein
MQTFFRKRPKPMTNEYPIRPAASKLSFDEQNAQIIKEAVASLKQVNALFHGTRTITAGMTQNIVNRSLKITADEAYSVRRHIAFTALSQYASMIQYNKVVTASAQNTDLLPIAHPLSSRDHAIHPNQLRRTKARWYADDPRITDPTVVSLLASAFSAPNDSPEYEYAVARLSAMDPNEVPRGALVAAFKMGGNQGFWRFQLRDSEGKFANMGGGIRKLVRRLDGAINWLAGNVVSTNPNTKSFVMETPNGKLVTSAASSTSSVKAILPGQQDAEGYSNTAAKSDSTSEITNEDDLEFLNSPDGYEVNVNWSPSQDDENYYGDKVDLGTMYEDDNDNYEVLQFEKPNAPSKDKFEISQQKESEGANVVAFGKGKDGELDPNLPVYFIRRKGEGLDYFAAVQSWAEVQSQVANDEELYAKDAPSSPKRPSLIPKPKATEQKDALEDYTPDELALGYGFSKNPNGSYDAPDTTSDGSDISVSQNNGKWAVTEKSGNGPDNLDEKDLGEFDSAAEALEFANAQLAAPNTFDKDTAESERADSAPEPEPEVEAEVVPEAASVPEGFYDVNRAEYVPQGAVDGQESEDFTDDPAELAEQYSAADLNSALREAASGSGYGYLPFSDGFEGVPAEALYNALKEKGEDADQILDNIYNGANGKPTPNVTPDTEEVLGEDLPEAAQGMPSENKVPALIDGMTDEEKQAFLEDGDYQKFLPENKVYNDADVPEGYYKIDENPFNVLPADLPQGAPEGFSVDPLDIANNYETTELIEQLRVGLSPNGAAPGYGVLGMETPEGENFVAFVPAEAIRDALQLQAVDTDDLIDDEYAQGFKGQGQDAPTPEEVEDALEGENVEEVEVAPEVEAAPEVADEPVQGAARVKVPVKELQAGDIAFRDGEYFIIEEIELPNIQSKDENNKGVNRVIVKGYYPGHESQERSWFANLNIEVIRGATPPAKGELPALPKPELNDYGKPNKKENGVWGFKDPAVQEKYNNDYAEWQAKVQNAAAAFDDPTKGQDAIESADLPVVAATLQEAPKEPNPPFLPGFPAFQGFFADVAKQAEGKWQAFKDGLKGRDIVVFDFETTGVMPDDGNEPWQIAYRVIRDGREITAGNVFMNPGRSIKGTYAGENAIAMGKPLTDEFLAEQMSQKEAFELIKRKFGDAPLLVAHNAKFDVDILERKFKEFGIEFNPAGIADTMGMAEQFYKDDAVDKDGKKRSKSLKAVSEWLKIKLENWHEADADVAATSEIFLKLIEKGIKEDQGLDALDIDVRQAEYDQKMEKIQPVIDRFNGELADYLAAKALQDGIAGKPVDLGELQKRTNVSLAPEGPIGNGQPMDNPEIPAEPQADLVDVSMNTIFPDGKMRIVDAAWPNNEENVDQLFKGQIKVEDLRPGDFVRAKLGENEFWQVIAVRGGEQFGVEEYKRAVFVQNAEGQQRRVYWRQNAFLDEVRRPKNRADLVPSQGFPVVPAVVERSEDKYTIPVSVPVGKGIIKVDKKDGVYVAQVIFEDEEGNEVYTAAARNLDKKVAEKYARRLLQFFAEAYEKERQVEAGTENGSKSIAVGTAPDNAGEIPRIDLIDDLPFGEGENEITSKKDGDAIVYESNGRVIDEDGDVQAQVIEEFPTEKSAADGGRENIEGASEEIARKIRDRGLLMSDGRDRQNLPEIPADKRRQVFIRLLAGLYADAGGNPLALGDKVIGVKADKAAEYGEGVVVGKIQGDNGGIQRNGVIYVDYVRVKYPDGTVRKFATRFQRHVDAAVARERFEAEPNINWMNADEMKEALEERAKKPRKQPEAEVEAVVELVEEVKIRSGVNLEKTEEPGINIEPDSESEPAPEPEPEVVPEVVPEPEAPAAEGDAFEIFNDKDAIRAKLVDLQQQLPKFRARNQDREARWLRREVDRLIGDIDNGVPIDLLGRRGEASLYSAQRHARDMQDAVLGDKFVEELRKLTAGRDAKAAELMKAREQEILDNYKKGLDKGLLPADKDAVNKEDFIKLLENVAGLFPDYNKAEGIDRNGHRAQDNLNNAIRVLQSIDEDKLYQLDNYLDNALRFMRKVDFAIDEKRLIADDFEKAVNAFNEKANEQKAIVYKEFYDKLAEPNSIAALDKDILNKDNLLEALNKVVDALPEGEFAPAELRTARRALRTFANEVEREGDKFPEVSSYYVNRAIEALRLDGNVDAAKYADILENISNIYSSPEVKERLRQERLAEFQKNLQEPFPQGAIEGDVNKQNLVDFAEALVAKLPESNKDLEKNVARAAYYARIFAADIRSMDDSDGGIRGLSIYSLDKIIEKLGLAPTLEKDALLPIVQSLKDALVNKKNELKGAARDRFLARRDAETPADLWPTPENETKQKFVDAVQDIFNRLPQDEDEDEDTRAIRAREYLKGYLEELNSSVDPLTASRKSLDSAISKLASSTDAKHKEFANILQSNISDYITQRLLARPVPSFAGINIDKVDPIALAEERVANRENLYNAPDNVKTYFADDSNYDAFLLPFKDQIKSFFNGDENAFAQMDIRARQALAQKVSQILKNPSANRTAEDLEFTKEIAKVVYALHQERDFYQPQRETVGVAERLMLINPDKVLEAFKKDSGKGQEVIIDGQPSGFTAKQVTKGVNSSTNYFVTDIATGQKFIFKKESTVNTARAEYEASKIAEALGIGGRVYVELHPMNQQYMVQTFAGDSVRSIGSAVEFMDAGINDNEAAARGNIVDLIGMGILDAIISNTDRHNQNFMVIDADTLGVRSNGYEDLYVLPIDHGYANALNGGDRGGSYSPLAYYNSNAGRNGGSLQKQMAAMMGATAYKELFDMSVQQVYQTLMRDNGANFDPKTFKVIMSRIDTLRGVTLSNWNKITGKD